MTVNRVSSLQPYQVVGSFEVVSVFFLLSCRRLFDVFLLLFFENISFSFVFDMQIENQTHKMYPRKRERQRERECMHVHRMHFILTHRVNIRTQCVSVRIFICLFCLLPALCQFDGDQNEERERKKKRNEANCVKLLLQSNNI